MIQNEFAKNILKFSIPSVVTAFVGICVLPIISRIYPEAEYGYINNFNSIGNLMMGVFLLGLDGAYIRFFNEPMTNTNRNGMFLFALKTGVVTSFAAFLVTFLCFKGKVLTYLFNENSSAALCLLYLYVLALIFYRLLNINNRFSEKIAAYNAQQVCFIIGNRLLFVMAAPFSTRFLPSAIIMLVSTAMIVIVSGIFQRREFLNSSISTNAKYEMIKFAIPIMPTTIVVFLNNSIASLILGGYDLRNDVGILAIAMTVANAFSVIPTAFGVYWGPFMYKNYRNEKNFILDVHDWIILLCTVLVLGMLVFQDLIYLLLGPNYRVSQSYFMLIMLSPVFTLLSETTIYGIALAKKPKYTLYTAILGSIINVLLCSLIIPTNGVLGAAIGISVSAMVMFVTRTLIAQRYYRTIRSYMRTMISCILIIMLCILNYFIYNSILLRIFTAFLVSIVMTLLYYKYLRQILIKALNFLK